MVVANERDDKILAHGEKDTRYDVPFGHGGIGMEREQGPLERPAVHHHDISGARPVRRLVPNSIEALGAGAIEHEAKGPAPIVLDEQDDRPRKVRVVQFRGSDQQMSGERTHRSLIDHGSGGGGRYVPQLGLKTGRGSPGHRTDRSSPQHSTGRSAPSWPPDDGCADLGLVMAWPGRRRMERSEG